MSIPALQGLMAPKVIYSTDSEINGHIDVIQVGKTRKIKVDDIEQSLNWQAPSAKRLVWGQAVEVLKEEQPDLENILVLGLGGATVQHFIGREFPEAQIVSIDIDPAMLEIAQNYFELDAIKNHRVLIADACRVIVEPENFELEKKSFQAIYVDIFVGSQYPDLGKSGNFVAAVKEMALPGGLVIFNRIYTEHHQDEVNNFVDFVEGFLKDVETRVVAGYTNSDNILIYGRA